MLHVATSGSKILLEAATEWVRDTDFWEAQKRICYKSASGLWRNVATVLPPRTQMIKKYFVSVHYVLSFVSTRIRGMGLIQSDAREDVPTLHNCPATPPDPTGARVEEQRVGDSRERTETTRSWSSGGNDI